MTALIVFCTIVTILIMYILKTLVDISCRVTNSYENIMTSNFYLESINHHLRLIEKRLKEKEDQ